MHFYVVKVSVRILWVCRIKHFGRVVKFTHARRAHIIFSFANSSLGHGRRPLMIFLGRDH